jgi:hypothetical protein
MLCKVAFSAKSEVAETDIERCVKYRDEFARMRAQADIDVPGCSRA